MARRSLSPEEVSARKLGCQVRCPRCGEGHAKVRLELAEAECSFCGESISPSDLRRAAFRVANRLSKLATLLDAAQVEIDAYHAARKAVAKPRSALAD